MNWLLRNILRVSFPSRSIPVGKKALFALLLLGPGAMVPICLNCQPLHAQPLLSVYDLAVRNDADLKAALAGHTASRELSKQALSKFLPNVYANAEYGATNLNSIKNPYYNPFYQNSGDIKYKSQTYSLTLSQPLINVGSLQNLIQARMQEKQADFDLENSRQELMIRVAELYLTALAAQDSVQTVEAEKAAVEQLFELTDKKFKNGLAAITDLHDAKARNALVSSNLIEAHNQRDDAFEALQEVCGVRLEEISSLTDRFHPVEPAPDDMESWVARALGENRTLVSLLYGLEAARREIEKQRAAHWPTMDLVGQFKRDEADNTVVGGPSESETAEVFARATLPLFQGGYVASKTREATARYTQADQKVERQRRAVIRETRAAFLGVKSSIRKIAALVQSLQSQRLTVAAKKEGYTAGLFTTLDILDAERDLYSVIRDLQKARYDYIDFSLKLKFFEGSLAEGDIAAVNNWFENEQ